MWAGVASADANTGNNVLAAATSIAIGDVWGGNFTTSTGSTQALTERGTAAWSIIPSPSSSGSAAELDSAAAVSSTHVWAAGDVRDHHLVLAWSLTGGLT
jgi:hypothetical protein